MQPDRDCSCEVDHCAAADLYADDIRDMIDAFPKGKVAGFFAESIQVK